MINNHNAAIVAAILEQYGPKLTDKDLDYLKDSCRPELVIKAIMERGTPLTEYDISFITKIVDPDLKFNDDINTEVLEQYADKVFNYEYNYKADATSIDPSIDPNQKQIGTMAQELEKVNPAVIDETSEGVKTVDTGKLALMNAGAIAQLAREVRELKELLK